MIGGIGAMAEESGARSAQTPRQQLNVYAPTCLDIPVNEPRIAPERAAPVNLLRLWFPESLQAYDAGDNLLWEHTFESHGPSWRYVNESMGDMKGGRAIRKTLRSVETVDGLALIDCTVRWRGVDIDLDLTITNVGPMAWARVVTSVCLQRPAARDYLDADDTRTWLCSDEGFVSAAELAFPPRRDSLYAWVGEELPMKSGARRRLAEPPVFAVSLDGRFVLGYAWQQARRLFLGAGRARCLHSDPARDGRSAAQVRRQGILFVQEGTQDAYHRYRAWSERLTAGRNMSGKP